MTGEPGEHLEEEPQSARGAPGSRDTGADDPSAGEHRREGAFDEESMISSGEPGWQRPDDAGGATASEESPVPPYDDRQQQAKSEEHMRSRAGDPDGGGQAQRSAVRHDKPSTSDEGVGPAHQKGTRRGEGQPPETTHPDQQ